MKKVLTMLILFVLFMVPAMSLDITEDKLKSDIIGKQIITSDANVSWEFENGEHFEFVIKKQRKTGNRGYRNIEYIIHIKSHKEKDGKYMTADGNLQLVYKENYPHRMYLSRIKQLGFFVKELSEFEYQQHLKADRFWHKLQYSIQNNLIDEVADMFSYPLQTKYLGNYNSKEELIKNYDKLFTSEVKNAINMAIVVPGPTSKGKEFNYDTGIFQQLCDYRAEIIKGGAKNFFTIKFVDDKCKINGISFIAD